MLIISMVVHQHHLPCSFAPLAVPAPMSVARAHCQFYICVLTNFGVIPILPPSGSDSNSDLFPAGMTIVVYLPFIAAWVFSAIEETFRTNPLVVNCPVIAHLALGSSPLAIDMKTIASARAPDGPLLP
ncbi:hypothetical protein niasHT_025711 [Heterodera trifolii]|uniref:Uncharacterized protein n=1 Tax=Heterodera trifolii TaxID=157864 RepID=A0ABD2K8I3_9BILA